MHDLSWFRERVRYFHRRGNSYMGMCPAHEDRQASLGISEVLDDDSGELRVVVNCLAGCSYHEILAALEDEDPLEVDLNGSLGGAVKTTIGTRQDYRQWWAEYTGIVASDWESWGVKFGNGVEFHLTGVEGYKVRLPNVDNKPGGGKNFHWEGKGKFTLWPDPPPEGENFPETIYLTEGESDFGPLKRAGFDVWSSTGGAVGKIDTGLFEKLHERGVEKIILAFDDDEGGRRGVAKLLPHIKAAGIVGTILDLSCIRDPFRGEKDIRDIWLRIRRVDLFREEIKKASQPQAKGFADWDSLEDIFQEDSPPPKWLVDDIWLDKSIGFFVGPPKVRKSIISLEMAIAIASGTPFMGQYDVAERGSVLIVAKEDTKNAIHARARGLMTARGIPTTIPDRDLVQELSLIKDKKTLTQEQRQTLTQSQILRNIRIKSETGFILDMKSVEQIALYCAHLQTLGIPPVKLIILDPLLRLLPVGTDLNSAVDVNDKVIVPVSMLSALTGASVMVVHHMGKSYKLGGDPTTSWMGSSMFFISAESYMSVPSRESTEDGYYIIHSGTKNSAESTWGYKIDFVMEPIPDDEKEESEDKETEIELEDTELESDDKEKAPKTRIKQINIKVRNEGELEVDLSQATPRD
jgi:hypothetical protein